MPNDLIVSQDQQGYEIKETQGYQGPVDLMKLLDVETDEIFNIPNEEIRGTIEAALNGLKRSKETKRKYLKAVDNAIGAGILLCDAIDVRDYYEGLNKFQKPFLRASIKLWSERAIREVMAKQNIANHQLVAHIVNKITLIHAMITGKIDFGDSVKDHTWLSSDEIGSLMTSFDLSTLAGKRAKAVIGLMLGAGLRRSECYKAKFSDITRLGDRYIINVIGKGNKGRRVPLSKDLMYVLDEWKAVCNGGYIARGVLQSQFITERLSPANIHKLVRKHGNSVGIKGLSSHDLRRSFADTARKAGVGIRELKLMLGHASEITTEIYLSEDINLDDTASDYIFMGVN